MKNRIIGGIGIIILGALLAAGPQKLFKICEQSHHSGASNCFWTGQALIGIGIVFALLGFAYLIFSDTHVRAGLSLTVAANIILTFLQANVLIGMDADAMMACRVSTLPAVNVISVIALVLASINTIYLLRTKRGKGAGGNARTNTLDTIPGL
jgi:hypothetical protein